MLTAQNLKAVYERSKSNWLKAIRKLAKAWSIKPTKKAPFLLSKHERREMGLNIIHLLTYSYHNLIVLIAALITGFTI
jgi:hypothetical protein